MSETYKEFMVGPFDVISFGVDGGMMYAMIGNQGISMSFVPAQEELITAGSKLTFDDAIALAKGCTDYSGGFRNDDADIFHNGIKTVVNVLESAKKEGGINSLQLANLHGRGQSNVETKP